jgi:hypothetical protein
MDRARGNTKFVCSIERRPATRFGHPPENIDRVHRGRRLLESFDDRLWSAWHRLMGCPRRTTSERGFSRAEYRGLWVHSGFPCSGLAGHGGRCVEGEGEWARRQTRQVDQPLQPRSYRLPVACRYEHLWGWTVGVDFSQDESRP